MPEPVELAWWCPSRARLARGAPREGDYDTYDGPLEPGRSGLHASALLLDALAYGESPIVCRVELEGEVAVGVGQRAAHLRRILWTTDVSKAIEDLTATTLPVLVRRVVDTWGDTLPPELLAIAEADTEDHAAAAEAALALREKADDERRDAEWEGKDEARIAQARRRAGAAHAAVLLTDETSDEAAHLARTAERIADAAAWLAWKGASFDEERLIARTLVSAWLGEAAYARREEVDVERYAREVTTSVERPSAPSPQAAFVPLSELDVGLSLFKTLMVMERRQGSHVWAMACSKCGATRHGPIDREALCLACGHPLRRPSVPIRPPLRPAPTDTIELDQRIAEREHLDAPPGAKPPAPPERYPPLGPGRAYCDACKRYFARADRPFDAGDTCPHCDVHDRFQYAFGTAPPNAMCTQCRDISAVTGLVCLDDPCHSCGSTSHPVLLASEPGDISFARCLNCGAIAQRYGRSFIASDLCPVCFATDLRPSR